MTKEVRLRGVCRIFLLASAAFVNLPPARVRLWDSNWSRSTSI